MPLVCNTERQDKKTLEDRVGQGAKLVGFGLIHQVFSRVIIKHDSLKITVAQKIATEK